MVRGNKLYPAICVTFFFKCSSIQLNNTYYVVEFQDILDREFSFLYKRGVKVVIYL